MSTERCYEEESRRGVTEHDETRRDATCRDERRRPADIHLHVRVRIRVPCDTNTSTSTDVAIDYIRSTDARSVPSRANRRPSVRRQRLMATSQVL
ncbi:unnamed protein product [Soboliphyme baturini]|uniref:Uncharacterized protein n=1 Tax=Soboliphyme baturini TaxID=241478 RepID=A0A183J0A3_9BILA|nr:unnamed protein product [Soboliphyme baturini]